MPIFQTKFFTFSAVTLTPSPKFLTIMRLCPPILHAVFLFFIGFTSLVSAVTSQEATSLFRAARYQELADKLKNAKAGATGSDLQRIERMLSGLEKFRSDGKSGPEQRPEAIERNKLEEATRKKQEHEEWKRLPRIITVGGFKGGWHAAVSRESPYGHQIWKFTTDGTFPREWIQEMWEKKYYITGVAGGKYQWLVVMSKFKDGRHLGQTWLGPAAIDGKYQTAFADYQAKDYRVTSVGGFDKHWVMIMTAGTGWGKQRFTLPREEDSDWVKARSAEGYHITAGSGDRLVDSNGNVTATYVLIATQGTGYTGRSWWLRGDQKTFIDWFKEQRETMVPLVLLGYQSTNGACFSSGTPFGAGCGYLLGAGTNKLNDWLLEQGCNK